MAWAQTAPVAWFSGQAQRVSMAVADCTATLTRIRRVPERTLPW
jgi:hypothetical protein